MGLSSASALLSVVSVWRRSTLMIAHDELADALLVLLMPSTAVSPCWRQGEGKSGHSIGTGSKEGLALVDAMVAALATMSLLLLMVLLLLMLMVLMLLLLVLPLPLSGGTLAPCERGDSKGCPSSSSCKQHSKVFMLLQVRLFDKNINGSNPSYSNKSYCSA